ncbi:MAG: asparagine synthase (glutamine-hydrolyzing) [Rhodospirillales bacterium]|nr:asparagine synthase (glutamine-hydrolyzing) [Rhodospirillales bacterium]
MCGIAGAIGPQAPSLERIKATLHTLGRRGPDAQGHSQYAIGGTIVTLIHTRLAIIDLGERANQPFERDGLVLTYNGEIYNYLELRRELEGLGHAFTTQSDTEVLVRAWRQWGAAALDRFEGMWAFALLDTKAGTLVLSRDRFGEKPLYTWRRDGNLYFASEIKALAALAGAKPAVNDDQVRRYLVNGYKCLHKQPATFFRDVEEFPAAQMAELTLAGGESPRCQPRPYWRLGCRPREMTATEALEGAKARLFESVKMRLRADVPLAFCLSGGIDSAILAAIAAKHFGHHIHCFSVIDKDERYDERKNIETMVEWLGCKHFAVHTSTAGFFERMAKLVAYHDQPVATISYYVHSFLSEQIAKEGYKVAVSGTAADELFTGYYDHYSMWLAAMAKQAETDLTIDFGKLLEEWRAGFGAHVENPLLQDPLAFAKDPNQRGHILLDQEFFESLLARPFHEDFTERDYCPELLRNRMLNELFEEAVPVILEEDDRNSMLYSVENRSPYLDRGLAKFLATVPSRHLIHGGFAKWLLRQAGEGLVPDQVRLDKRKRGFNASVDSVIDRRDATTRERLLADGPIFELVSRERMAAFLDQDMTPNSFSKFLFSFVSARMFLDHHAAWRP